MACAPLIFSAAAAAVVAPPSSPLSPLAAGVCPPTPDMAEYDDATVLVIKVHATQRLRRYHHRPPHHRPPRPRPPHHRPLPHRPSHHRPPLTPPSPHPPARQVLNPASFLLRKESASLAALLAHALGAWQEHRALVESEQVSVCLARHDLYARQALRALPSRSQLDLSRWTEAHLLLSALVRDVETLPRFASHEQSSWHALGRLSRVAAEVGCTEEACFGLLTRPDQLSAELQQHEATATKLQRLLGWTPASAVGVVSPGSAFAGQVNS